MHQSAIFLTLATVALGASARANIYTTTDTTTTTATANLLNPSALAAGNVGMNVPTNVETISAIVRPPITVELGRRMDVNTDLLKQESGKSVDVNVQKRQNLNVDTALQQEHKLISVALNRHLDANVITNPITNTQTTATANLSRGRMPTALEVARRQLDYDINTALANEHKLIAVDMGKTKRDFQMSTGYVWDPAMVDAKSQGAVVAKRDLDVHVKPEYQRLSARHKHDNYDDWEDNEEDEDEGEGEGEGEDEDEDEDEDQTLNETESIVNKETEKKKKDGYSLAGNKKKEFSFPSSTMGQRRNAASRTNAFTGLSSVGLLVGSAFLWA
ncbi:hypothetical protein BG015_011963 [Linnemannia schmuckeri]|uniref:Uncharacterized protein n=1 Tax=Linnemannia schmuckeri TaxID=64567 RepID=A0A9P5RS16_9FUNG|nr:hypothetical protein BG015_011963 [Linnemannia schmuckeri]